MLSVLGSSSVWPRWSRFIGLSSAAVFTLLAVRTASVRTADQLGRSIAEQLTAVLAPLRQGQGGGRPLGDEAPSALELVLSETPPARAAANGPRPRETARRKLAQVPRAGVRISAAQVLTLAARRAMPQAVPVPATALHPKGLLLRGVSALGVGLKDGDVLTEAAGQSASSVAVVVGIVLAARGRLAPEISGRFFRGGVPFGLTVEQPYPKWTVPG